MKKIKIELIVELDKNDVGFMIIPTSNKNILKNNYTISKRKTSNVVHPWSCSNGVQLIDTGNSLIDSDSENGD